MNATCEHCRHWQDLDGKFKPPLGVCGLTFLPGYFDERKSIQNDESRLAMAQDGSDYRAYLITRKDFGCVQFAAR